MISNNRKFVQYEEVVRILGRNIGNEQLAGRILERVKFRLGRSIFTGLRLLRKRGTKS
jgi:hypothetical protein